MSFPASSLTTLQRAVIRGDDKAVATLLAQDPSLIETCSALIQFLSEGSPVHSGAENDNRRHRILRLAAREGHGGLVAQILTKWPALIDRKPSVLDDAVIYNKIEIISQLLALDPTLQDRHPSWRWAALHGFDDALNLMLSHNPSSIDGGGSTALTLAAREGRESTVTLLLAKRPELIDIPNRNGQTALHLAASIGKLNMVRQLLDHKPELIGMVDDNKVTALHFAALGGWTEVIDYLLDRKIELSDMVNTNGQNALHLAANFGQAEAFLKLLARNPRSIDVVTSANRNTLNLAATGGEPQVLEAVLSLRPGFACGVDIGDDTALHRLCLSGLSDARGRLEPYLERLWQLNPSALLAMNKKFETPLICSTSYSKPDWGTEFFIRKLSWDAMIQEHEELKRRNQSYTSSLELKLQALRTFAEEQCNSALSTLLIPEVIDIVEEYFFFLVEPRFIVFHTGKKRLRGESPLCGVGENEEK